MLKFKQSENLHGAGKKGLIKTIIVIVIALIVLGYFGFNVTDIINSPTVQSNLNSAWGLVMNIWTNYLAAPVTYVFGILWRIIQSALPAK